MSQATIIEQQLAAAEARIAELEEEIAHYQTIINNVPGMVYEFKIDAQGVSSFTYVSEGSRDIYNVAPEEIVANAGVLLNAVHPADQESFQASVAESAQTLQPWRWEGRPLNQGQAAWIGAQAEPEAQPDGSIVWRGIVIDITQQKTNRENLQRYLAVLDSAPDIIGIADMDGGALYFNPAGRHMAGVPENTNITGQPIDVFHPEWAARTMLEQGVPTAIAQGSWYGESAILDRDGTEIPVSQMIVHYPGDEHLEPFLATIMRDIREQKRIEAEREKLQQAVIKAQQTAIAELSTPLIQLHKDVVLMPLIGSLDTYRAMNVMETLLNGTAQHRARIAIIDVSGVPVVDTQVGATLIQAAQALRLLGSQVVLTGIRPEMAQTLVSLNIDLRTLETFGTLVQGLDYVFGRTISARN